MIIRSSQKYFPPNHAKGWYPYVDQDNVLKVKTRYQSQQGSVVNIISPPLISHKDSHLVSLVIRHNHIKNVENNAFSIHLPKNITIGGIRNNPSFKIEITRVGKAVEEYIKKCTRCTHLSAQPLSAALGKPRWLKFLDNNSHPYKFISIDPIGPYRYTLCPGSRQPPRKMWVLVVSCLLTSATLTYILQGMLKADIWRAIHTHCERTCRPRVIYTDHGSNMHLSESDPQFDSIFAGHGVEIIMIGPSEQFSNTVEARIKILKRLIRSRKNQHMPSLLLTQWVDFLETLSNLINSRPIFSTQSGNLVLTPNHLTKSWITLDQSPQDYDGFIPEVNDLESRLQSLFQSLSLAAREFMESLKFSLISNSENLKIKSLQSPPLRPGDVVLVSRRNQLFLGVVEGSLARDASEKGGNLQFYFIRRKNNGIYCSEKINIRNLTLLHRPCISLEPPVYKDNEILDLRTPKASSHRKEGVDTVASSQSKASPRRKGVDTFVPSQPKASRSRKKDVDTIVSSRHHKASVPRAPQDQAVGLRRSARIKQKQ